MRQRSDTFRSVYAPFGDARTNNRRVIRDALAKYLANLGPADAILARDIRRFLKFVAEVEQMAPDTCLAWHYDLGATTAFWCVSHPGAAVRLRILVPTSNIFLTMRKDLR
jgi:hypothetical protein